MNTAAPVTESPRQFIRRKLTGENEIVYVPRTELDCYHGEVHVFEVRLHIAGSGSTYLALVQEDCGVWRTWQLGRSLWEMDKDLLRKTGQLVMMPFNSRKEAAKAILGVFREARNYNSTVRVPD